MTAFRSEKEPETVRVVTKMIIALLFLLAIAVPICQSQPSVLKKVRKAYDAKNLTLQNIIANEFESYLTVMNIYLKIGSNFWLKSGRHIVPFMYQCTCILNM